MALKGSAVIELTDVKTGKKEIVKHDNLVTNAVPSILNENPFAWQLKTSYNSSYFAGNMLPLCPNLFGGILLYEDAIPEDVNQLFAQSTNKLVGYSSNNVNSKTDVMRGSMNQTESGVLEDGSGYRFVFDFTTSQANGTISSVGLTSKWGGMAGYGSTEWPNTQSPTVYYEDPGYVQIDYFASYPYMTLLHYNEETGIATSMYVSGQNTITTSRIQMHTQNWALSRKLDLFDATKIVETQIIETDVFAGSVDSKYSMYYNFCDSKDGYIWGFEHAGGVEGNSSGSASINWIKIKVDDLTFEEGTWSVDGQLYSMGRHPKNFGTANFYYMDWSNSAVLDGYLYCLNYSLTGVYKINLSNVTDIKFIEHPDKKIYTYSTSNSNYYYYYAISNLSVLGNRICLWNGWVNVDEIVKNAFSVSNEAQSNSMLNDGWIYASSIGGHPQHLCAGSRGIDIGVFTLKANGYVSDKGYGYIRSRILLNSPYLATINNLATPVQKTADKTMKITYILREETA